MCKEETTFITHTTDSDKIICTAPSCPFSTRIDLLPKKINHPVKRKITETDAEHIERLKTQIDVRRL